MTRTERKKILDSIAARLLGISQEIETLIPELSYDIDQKVAKSIVTDLHWATENCTVIGLHQIGETLDDQMGVAR
jgi:hypothetical protein